MLSIIFAALGAGDWQFETQRDPLGQAVYVAAVAPDPARPYVALKFQCGGVTGVVLQFNLGEVSYAQAQFATNEPDWEDVRFTFVEGDYNTAAKRAPITDGLATYEIKGSDAAFVAGLLRASESVTIKHTDTQYTFPLAGAQGAIGEVLDACPFKYPDAK